MRAGLFTAVVMLWVRTGRRARCIWYLFRTIKLARDFEGIRNPSSSYHLSIATGLAAVSLCNCKPCECLLSMGAIISVVS